MQEMIKKLLLLLINIGFFVNAVTNALLAKTFTADARVKLLSNKAIEDADKTFRTF